MGYLAAELQFAGIGKETTWGTPAASTYFPPVSDPKMADVPTLVSDSGRRGIMADTFARIQSIRSSTAELDGAVYADSFGLLLLSMFGLDTVTGTTSKTHKFGLAPIAQPPSITINYFNGFNERQFAGMKCEELDIKWAKGAALEYTSKYVGKTSTVLATTETPTITTMQQIMAWNFGLTLNSVANLNLESFEIDLKRKSDPINSANSTQDPAFVLLEGMTATGKVTFDVQDDTELLLALNNTQVPMVLTGTQSGTNYGVTITSTLTSFDTPAMAPKGYMQLNMNFESVYNATDAGPCTISLINNVTSY